MAVQHEMSKQQNHFAVKLLVDVKASMHGDQFEKVMMKQGRHLYKL